MSALRYIAVCLGVLAVSLTTVNGLSDKDRNAIRNALVPAVTQCGDQYGVSVDQLKAAEESRTLTDLNPCVLSCVLKKTGIFNDKGTFDITKSTELARKYLPDEDEQKIALDIIQTCAPVNDQSVGDENQGCERVKLLVECYLPFRAAYPDAP